MGLHRLWHQPVETIYPKIYTLFLGTEGHAPKQDRAYQIGITSQKNIICYVKERGLFYFDEQQQEFIRLKNKLPNNIKKFVIDNENRLVFLTEEGKLYLYFLLLTKVSLYFLSLK